MKQPVTPIYRLEDYQPTPYAIPKTQLDFCLEPTKTCVTATLFIEPRNDTKEFTPLILSGDELTLISVFLNGKKLAENAYKSTPSYLEITRPPAAPFTLELITEINPAQNSQLMGLYLSNGVYCTQCEAEGFRRITYFYDRPDVLSTYTVKIEADSQTTPILLSNGNLVETGTLDNNRHFAVWTDPYPKPSYLFALVGGNLDQLKDYFTTASGRRVKLGIYVEKGKAEYAMYAMDALKRSMRWDEECFGREYDLDVFNIVAVSDFNMGAMENKGLNIFNDKYILADPETATDRDYKNIERIIAHEYFHNWTGNRITCRDWFQLCLKEGLTVYRDQEFSSDQNVRSLQRIENIKMLKATQFPEDSGPLAHPVRPRQYSEINNFYTTTVYEKGAEVVRMVHTILGSTLFRKGMDLYFQRHDGQACTIEDFISCFAEVSGQDFSQFMLWYEQAGTPNVEIDSHYNEGILTIHAKQYIPKTPQQNKKSPMLIPIAFGLLGHNGEPLTYEADKNIQSDVMMLSQESQTFTFRGLSEKPILSLLRNFSAPITLHIPFDESELIFLAQNDSNQINRWQSLNYLMTQTLIQAIKDKTLEKIAMPSKLLTLIATIVKDENLEPEFRALCLSLPSEIELAHTLTNNIDPDRIYDVRNQFLASIAHTHQELFATIYAQMQIKEPYSPNTVQTGKRALRNIILDYLSLAENKPDHAITQYEMSDNMTDRIASLNILVQRFNKSKQTQNALSDFETRYKNNPLVMDKWFSIQAIVAGKSTLDHVQKLMKHPLFSQDNPNRVRALIGAFATENPTSFHRIDGASYHFLCQLILEIDKKNPQLASRLLTIMRSWQQWEPIRQKKLEMALKTIAAAPKLSSDVADIINRILT
ncbi:aminopeptidase N [Bartonella bacilliformis Peru38]|uniref:aminopeptidase N n=1 Tax=Bartonella bacilliformis TaxID=774 RepID=UPI000447E026|nr:aminopeptidase N [Bartonella bacilliformis]EYS94986.1 aminopeptidase N [Bartonella bacilliformis Peru-18]KEG17659.1 aminopeptidase N [Bartonella bacilliformis CUSCO5]KEG20867.1 aminopeptidase N [Bartonella bacilliformis Peru38]KEG22562.1 aminopeptidase N [Bartonella bacilliformis Ver075]KZM37885.1 aminopeptidase N [Bartonella bacilliformis]